MADFTIATTDWPTSGTATTGSTTFDTVNAGYTHGQDDDGKYIVGDGSGGDIYFQSLASQGTFWNAAANGTTYDTVFYAKIVSLQNSWDSTTGWESSTLCFFMDIASTFELRLRHVEADGLLDSNGVPRQVRIDANEVGMTIRPRGSVWVPLNKLFKIRARVEKTAGNAVVSLWINDELVVTGEGATSSSTNLRSIVIWRGLATNGDCDMRLYGPFTGTENVGAVTPDTSFDGEEFIARGLSITSDTGHWALSGTTTLGGDWGEGAIPAWGLPYVTLGASGTATTRSALGTIPSKGGKGVIRFLLRPNAGNTTITLNQPGDASSLRVLRFVGATGKIQQSPDGSIFSAVLDSDGADQVYSATDPYELVIHFNSGRPTYELHQLSADWETEQSLWAGELNQWPVGVPTLGKAIVAGTSDTDFAGLFMQTRSWRAMCSSYTSAKNTTSDMAGRAHLLDAAWRYGQSLADGGEINGIGAGDLFQCPSDAHLGRSGHNLTNWTDFNPAYEDLLPFMPASRWVFFDTSVNDLSGLTLSDQAAVTAAGDAILAETQAFITAAAANGVEAEFGSQVPCDAASANWTAATEAEQIRIDIAIKAQLDAAGRPDLFTYSDNLESLLASESDLQGAQDAVFDIGTDSIHYSNVGDNTMYQLWYTLQTPTAARSGGSRRSRAHKIFMLLD